MKLRIDENGRAVTETSVVGGVQDSRMDTESDSETSDSSTDIDDRMVLSQQQSFMRPASRQKHGRKARFADEPYSHSQRSSEASTLASTRTGSSSGHRKGYPVMNTGHAQAHFPPSQSFASRPMDNETATIIDSDGDMGDAQAELKKVVRERSQKKGSKVSAPKQKPASRRQSYATGAQSSTPYYGVQHRNTKHGAYPDPHPISSPTTITDAEFATPNSRVSDISSESTRCICNQADGNGQLMIQW